MLDIRLVDRPTGPLVVLPENAGTVADLRRVGAETARAATSATLDIEVAGLDAAALAEGLILGSYQFRVTRPLRRVRLVGATDPAAIERVVQRAAATCWARDLTNQPASTKTPVWLARQAQDALSEVGVRVTIHDESWLRAEGFGGVLAVAGGSARPPRLIQAEWGPRSGRHVVLVGKGITFDTGGLNLKTGTAMRPMYTDMAGGAAVLGAIRAVAALNLPIRVTALVPAAENALSGSSYRPSDVVRHYGGRTTEVLNTDAEGRMVLADTLAYAVDRLRPAVLIDVATLTGAMKVSLGLSTAGLLATDDGLAAELAQAAERSGEPIWRMPFVADYEPLLDSAVADANNAPGSPGGIGAAHFLRPFTGGRPWAHLDIAGPARSSVDSGVLGKGATGFGVRLLTSWLES